MTHPRQPGATIAIACGGTGGHLFPGLALGTEFIERGCRVTLLISRKEVDQQAAKAARGMDVISLPSVGLTRGGKLAFLRGFLRSYRAVDACFRENRPDAVVGMGGFTSAPAVLCGRRRGAMAFLHESNSIPGRANRLLSHFASNVFVGFPTAAKRLPHKRVIVSGTPVRSGFGGTDPGTCRSALGFDPDRPLLLVTGGSQGAFAVNRMALETLPSLSTEIPELQWLHLTGPGDYQSIRQAYEARGVRARVELFLDSMEAALGAATLAVSRAGASSIAEMAAARLPAILIPYPSATDNHQYYNALALEETGAARLLEERMTSSHQLGAVLLELLRNAEQRENMRRALAAWHQPEAARIIADTVLHRIPAGGHLRRSRTPASLDHRASPA